jgi:hypothetical protein
MANVMCGKLWTFGDSHTAGQELGTGLTSHDIDRWVKSITSFNNHLEAEQMMSATEYALKIMMPWDCYIKECFSPELSYAGILAKNKKLNLNNRAMPGASMDQIFKIFYSTVGEINFDEDEVIVAPTYFGRWITQQNKKFNFHLLDDKNLLSYMQLVPCDSTQILYYYSMIFYMQTNYPKIRLVKIYDDHYDYGIYKKIKFVNDISMFSYFRDTIHDRTRYPGQHFNEAAHEYFATYINEKWYD